VSFNIGSSLWPGISKLIEEAGEVVQVCGKLLATKGDVNHWDGTNLKDRLQEEIGDLMAACFFVQENCGLDKEFIRQRIVKKLTLFNEWHANNQL
jgi:NTP pyrophosphatase (non-canonical NTP hydrolase)